MVWCGVHVHAYFGLQEGCDGVGCIRLDLLLVPQHHVDIQEGPHTLQGVLDGAELVPHGLQQDHVLAHRLPW